ncbi:MAG: LptF/LptG family permease [Bacteroidales bacterium]|nr:LptF/LptG family permease [Candidatus Equimonas enterica]
MKRIDTFILKNFLQIFVGAFFVCLFVFMLQFTYRYVDELVGKGLSLEILAKFFWYMAISLVPTSLPLGVLLASLITFGNMGEKLSCSPCAPQAYRLFVSCAPCCWWCCC